MNKDSNGRESRSSDVPNQAFKEVLGRTDMTQMKLATALGVSVRTVQRYASGKNPVRAEVRERFFELYGLDTNALPGDDHNSLALPEKMARAKSPGVQHPWWVWFLGHMRLRWRFGINAVRPDPWRKTRDGVLVCACVFYVVKIFHVMAGVPFGLRDDIQSPLSIISLVIILMFGYAFVEDLFRKRYFLGARDD